MLTRSVLLVLALGSASGCNPPTRIPAAKAEPSAYAIAVLEGEREVSGRINAADAQPGSWFRLGMLARAQLDLAKLTGEYETYAAALATCARAFEIAPAGGPLTACASIDLAVHRLDDAEPRIRRSFSNPITGTGERIEQHLMLADIAMQRGDFDAARTSIDAASALLPNDFGVVVRQAFYLWRTGDPGEADELFGRASTSMGVETRTRAWVALQRGLLALDTGLAEAALEHFDAAEEIFGGWWLIHEHRAEALARLGRETEARIVFAELARSPGFPEHLDALSALAEPRDRSRLRREAGDAHRARMEVLDSAAIGHALDHFLMYGTTEEALELAERNHALRPGPESKIKLAQALMRAGRAEDALARIREALATRHSTPALHATAYWVFLATGDEPRAAAERERVIDEDAIERLSWMRVE